MENRNSSASRMLKDILAQIFNADLSQNGLCEFYLLQINCDFYVYCSRKMIVFKHFCSKYCILTQDFLCYNLRAIVMHEVVTES